MKQTLSPFDCDMCAMMENITKKSVETSISDNFIFYRGELGEMKSNPQIGALKSAIKGRLGERFISFDRAINDKYVVMGRTDAENWPEEIRFELKEPEAEAGDKYARKLKEVDAIQFEVSNIHAVCAFTGGGTLVVPSCINNDQNGLSIEVSKFSFINKYGLYLTAKEGQFILLDEHGLFSIMNKEAFYKDYELKN